MSWIGLLVMAALAAQPPKIGKLEGFFYLDVGADIQRTLKSFDPFFTPWTDSDFIPSVRENYKATNSQTLGAVVADFNGDKKPDVALMGRGRNHNLLVAVISKDAGYEVMEIDRSPVTNPNQSWIEGAKGSEKDSGDT